MLKVCNFFISQKREKDGEQHLKEEEMRRRQKIREQEAKVSFKLFHSDMCFQ